jgi:hypothetical protein
MANSSMLALPRMMAPASFKAATQSRRRSCTSWMADSGVYSGSTPLVSTALICSTMRKNH